MKGKKTNLPGFIKTKKAIINTNVDDLKRYRLGLQKSEEMAELKKEVKEIRAILNQLIEIINKNNG